jgi:hypothetical protein
MATQLGQRPSRVERVGSGGNNPIGGIVGAKKAINNLTKKPITLNFICMLAVVGVLDIVGVFTSEFPGVGIVLSILYNIIFIPWFYFSGIKFNLKKIGTMGTTSILEYIPIVGNLPFMTLNVVYSYYSE